jgi:hypothetical protein
LKTEEERGVVSVLTHVISSPKELLATVCLVTSLTQVRRQFQFCALECTTHSTARHGTARHLSVSVVAGEYPL